MLDRIGIDNSELVSYRSVEVFPANDIHRFLDGVMPKRTAKNKDVNQIAHAMAEAIAAGNVPRTSDGKDALAVLLGRRGGLKGGPARAAKLTGKQLSESARKAALARWAKKHD
jgi:hypothetical protein